jgi:hypothetical protein
MGLNAPLEFRPLSINRWFRKTLPLLVSILLLALGGPIWAADLPISVVSLSSPVAPFDDATMEIQTKPGANCAISVLYKSGPSRARGLISQVADRKGRIGWRWRVGSNTTPGRWPIVVTCQKEGDTGELRTNFDVR